MIPAKLSLGDEHYHGFGCYKIVSHALHFKPQQGKLHLESNPSVLC